MNTDDRPRSASNQRRRTSDPGGPSERSLPTPAPELNLTPDPASDRAEPAAEKPAPTEVAGLAGNAPLTFRLDEESQQVLAQRAQHLGVSPHQMARHYVLQCLYEPEERAAVNQALRELCQETVGLRTDLANAVVGLLCSAGRVEQDEAQTWVNENLNQ